MNHEAMTALLLEKTRAINAYYDSELVRDSFAGDDPRLAARQKQLDALMVSFTNFKDKEQPVENPPVVAQNEAATTELTKMLIQQQELQLRPWLAYKLSYIDSTKAHDARTIEELQQQYFDAAKNNSLPVWKAIIGTYTLYYPDALKNFSSTLMDAGSFEELVYNHNMFVVQKMQGGDHYFSKHHAAIRALTVPLFPPLQQFSTFNLGIVQEQEKNMSLVSGGGHHYSSFSAFMKVTQTGFGEARRQETLGGEPFLPVQQLPNGQYGVDMQDPYEHARNTNMTIRNLQRQVSQLQNKVNYANPNSGRGGYEAGRGRGGRGRGNSQQNSGNNNTNNNNQNRFVQGAGNESQPQQSN